MGDKKRGIKYLSFNVSIHGLDVKDKDDVDFLIGWLKTSTLACLMGKCKEHFGFRDEYESDIEVTLIEYAGAGYRVQSHSIEVNPGATNNEV